MLARHGRRLLNLLDDTPVVPGDTRPPFEHAHQARQVLNDAEEDLREWAPNLEPVPSAATGLGSDLIPTSTTPTTATSVSGHEKVPETPRTITEGGNELPESADRRDFSGNSAVAQAENTNAYQQ